MWLRAMPTERRETLQMHKFRILLLSMTSRQKLLQERVNLGGLSMGLKHLEMAFNFVMDYLIEGA